MTSTGRHENRTAYRREKMQRLHDYLGVVEGAQSYLFRIFALLFLLGVETTLLRLVYLGREIGGAELTAITIIAVLPILVIRAFDISVLNLSKEGIEAEMIRSEVKEALSRVDHLFALTMSEPVYRVLLSLTGEGASERVFDEDVRRQLCYLQDIGYARAKSDPPQLGLRLDLRDHYEVTDTGKEFAELRRRAAVLP